MQKTAWLSPLTAILFLAAGAACGSTSSPSPELPAAPETEQKDLQTAEAPEGDAAGAEADDEEAKRKERAARLAKAREKLAATDEKERERWTDELREQARVLAETEHDNFAAALEAALASDHRMPGHADRDEHRHPLETMTFFGLEPDMTVLEYGPGAGWYTEILAPSLSPRGKLVVTAPKLEGDRADSFYALYFERLQRLLDRSPELFGGVEKAFYDPDADAPDLGLSGEVDAVLMIRGMHNRARDGDLQPWLATFFDALRPGGVFGVVQHRAAEGADPEETAKKGYLPQAWVIEQVEAAGFVFEESSEVNANPDDTRDYERGVWTLPPTLALGDEDRETYEAIGESDRMTLRFVKPTGE